MNLKYASTALQNDPEVVMEALKNSKVAFQYAGDKIKNNKEN